MGLTLLTVITRKKRIVDLYYNIVANVSQHVEGMTKATKSQFENGKCERTVAQLVEALKRTIRTELSKRSLGVANIICESSLNMHSKGVSRGYVLNFYTFRNRGKGVSSPRKGVFSIFLKK